MDLEVVDDLVHLKFCEFCIQVYFSLAPGLEEVPADNQSLVLRRQVQSLLGWSRFLLAALVSELGLNSSELFFEIFNHVI